MSLRKILIIIAIAWLALITLIHASINLHIFRAKQTTASGQNKFRIGFLPVTCHLTCPVTDFINKQMTGESIFDPVRFNGWPELKEAYLSGYTPATFILAPMAMALHEQGVPIKIVYLGHRDGSAVMVQKDSQIYRMEDLRGKRVAVPNRFSNQRLLIFRALKQANMSIKDIELVEMPPPDMPAALYAKAVDAISCGLAVHEDMIKNKHDTVQRLVDGIAKSGKWIDKSMEHRMETAQFVSKF